MADQPRALSRAGAHHEQRTPCPFGLVGLFVGPVLLAVAYRLIGAWVAEQDPGASAATDAKPDDQEVSA